MRLEPPSWWYSERIGIRAWALWPASMAYGKIVERRFAKASPYRSRLPVLCVGNFTMGGGGKTPVALKLAPLLQAKGLTPGFLTRGFGGSQRGPHVVKPGEDRADRVGDEPLLLAEAALTVVSRDRPAGARLLETLGSQAIIMDDGFQNPSLHKDFSLLVVDGGAGLGTSRVFPLGPLRARLRFQLARTDAVLILGEDRTEAAALIEGESHALGIEPPLLLAATITPTVPPRLRDGKFLAFCGIGRPAKFFDTLADAGVTLQDVIALPDHHAFTEAEARRLLDHAKDLDAHLVTTEKDRARLKGFGGALGELYDTAIALPIEISFSQGDEAKLWAAVESAMRAHAPIRAREER